MTQWPVRPRQLAPSGAVGRLRVPERQRLLIREANFLRGLVGLPPVRGDGERKDGEVEREAKVERGR